MRRRAFILALAGAAAWPLALRAQQPGRVYRIGFLANDPTIPTQPAYRAFLEELGSAGFIAGKNVLIEHRFAEAKLDRYSILAAELIRLESDVIVTSTPAATLAAKRATTKIPIVMLNTNDPIGQGIVANLAHPGGNVTGFASDDSAEIAAKRLQLFKLAVPRISHVAILLDPDFPHARSEWEQLEHAAPGLNVALRQLTVRQASDFEDAFAAIVRDGLDAVLLVAGPLGFVNRKRIMQLAAMSKLPVMSTNREQAEAGGLLSYGYVRRESFRQAAAYVVKIFKGANPADLPVELPVKYELVVNLTTANALGLTLTDSFLQLADEVIE
jgi:putative ABC transport system substrate-binding protein